jgi:fibronectin type 3 domain-containing protein
LIKNKKRAYKIIGMVASLLILNILNVVSGPTTAKAATTINLGTSWKFATDPNRVGITQQWYSDTFDDSAWQTILSGQPWESQGVDYAGYAWYRQKITIAASDQGAPLRLVLAAIYSDDDVYFNGVRIGGLKGEYKYNNRKLRTYTVPASTVRYGQSNTIAIRIWGGNIGFEKKKSGLVAGTYQAVLDHYQIMARPTGGAITEETPISLWDLSSAQRGAAFELVYRFDPADLPGNPVDLQYTITDYSKVPIKTGTIPVTASTDGIARGVISIDAATSQLIYLAGRFKIEWQFAESGSQTWVDTGQELTVTESATHSHQKRVYKKTFSAGTVALPADGDGTPHGMYTVIVKSTAGLSITNLNVADTANAADWSLQSNLQVGDIAYGDRTYPFSSVPSTFAGAQWIRTANDSKSFAVSPIVTFNINQQADVYLAVDTRAGRLPWLKVAAADNLNFSQRDATALPALSDTYENTPYGSLKLIDRIDASTPLTTEIHPYVQGAYTAEQQFNTPGSHVNVSVKSILGKQARESEYGWFGYRVGRGQLTPGKTYLLRIEYPEDKPRYAPIEVQLGQNYMDIGWRNGVSPDDVYDNWPLSKKWQFYDVIVPVGEENVGAGGTGDADGKNGFWVYFMNKLKPGYYFSLYSGGPAVRTINLYEIDPATNAPTITLPQGLPQRTLMFDWERQPTQDPVALVNYAKLMGYSAISPVILKWAFANYGDPLAGYTSINVDDANYWVSSEYTLGSGQAPPPAVPGKSSVHQQYLTATHNSGVDYIPRFEFGGSYDLPTSARAIGADGNLAKPNRFADWGANLLNQATWNDLKVFMDSLLKPNVAANPQLTGALWRIRSDRMQISYGPDDIALFCSETATTPPPGLTNAQLAAWASSGEVGVAYGNWWQGKRAAFHQQLVNLMKSYRPDMTLYYYNWDQDKFALLRPDLNQGAFFNRINAIGGPAAYAEDRAARATFTGADYVNAIKNGDFSGPYGVKRPDYALHPSLYSNIPGIQLMAPAEWLPYADKPEYLNYFQTKDGLAVSNAVSYDEAGSRYINPKFEGNMVTPGGAAFSMAMELLGYYHGDARTLTYTVYTYGRGFADAHRRFAQAFRALPAVPGTVVEGTPTDTKVRTYPTANGTYVGIAYKGYAATALTIDLPGTWNSSAVVKNLVTNQVVPTVINNGKLQISLQSGPMELNAFLVTNGASQAPQAPTSLTATGKDGQVSLNWTAASETTSYNVKRATTSGGPYSTVATNVTGTTYTNTGLTNGTTYYYVVSAVNANGESANSTQASAMPQLPPSPPTGLTATTGAERVTLNWTASGGATSYNIKRALTSGGPYVTVATGITGTSYINTGLTSDVPYYYVVSAVSPSGESANSNQASTTPQPVPLAPTGLTATTDIGQTTLNWTASSGATKYNVKRAVTSGGPYSTIAAGVTETGFTDIGLATGMTYYYVVSAVNAYNNESLNSVQVSVTPVSALTSTFTSVAALDGYILESNESSNVGGSISSTAIRAGDMSTDLQSKGILSFDTSSIPDNARILSTTLKLRRSTISGTNPFDTHGLLYVDIKGGTGFNGSTTLEAADFQATADATQVATLSNAANNLDWSTGDLSTTGLNLIDKTGQTQFRVYFALDDNDNATSDFINWYASETSTVANRPVLEVAYDLGTIPTGLTATVGNAQTALNWTAVGGATSYNVKRAVSSGGPYTTVASDVTATHYTDTGLTNGTTYYYVISAVNANGESPNSAQVSATLTGGVQTRIMLTSVATQDGYVMESNETSNIGGAISSTTIRAGDHSNGNQNKGILSFDTSSIPDTAMILSVTLKLRRLGVTGDNPFYSHGPLYVDIKGGTGFNGSTSLENGDFQAAADATQVATLSTAVNNLDWSTGDLSTTGLNFIDKTGQTQFRVYFALDDNNDGESDYINWYAAESSVSANRPVLEIVYQ